MAGIPVYQLTAFGQNALSAPDPDFNARPLLHASCGVCIADADSKARLREKYERRQRLHVVWE